MIKAKQQVFMRTHTIRQILKIVADLEPLHKLGLAHQCVCIENLFIDKNGSWVLGLPLISVTAPISEDVEQMILFIQTHASWYFFAKEYGLLYTKNVNLSLIKQVLQELELISKKDRNIVLIIGAHDTGKSCIGRHLYLLDAKNSLQTLASQIIEEMRCGLYTMMMAMIAAKEVTIPEELQRSLEYMFNSATVSAIFNKILHLIPNYVSIEGLPLYLDLPRIASPNYVPSQTDAYICTEGTHGLREYDADMNGIYYQFVEGIIHCTFTY